VSRPDVVVDVNAGWCGVVKSGLASPNPPPGALLDVVVRAPNGGVAAGVDVLFVPAAAAVKSGRGVERVLRSKAFSWQCTPFL
jgi:hypothetical protein